MDHFKGLMTRLFGSSGWKPNMDKDAGVGQEHLEEQRASAAYPSVLGDPVVRARDPAHAGHQRGPDPAEATGGRDRADTEGGRTGLPVDRLRLTASREETARRRDLRAQERDRAAAQRDAAAARYEAEHGLIGLSSQAAQELVAEVRRAATADRSSAASDREQAATDRRAAEEDRERARRELRDAQLDQLTGAFGRELGLATLEREMNRARHGNESMVLAFVDVDGLKHVNDRRGHAAGDALLRDVVAAMHTHLRSYDPVVRVGGDEFVCALVDCTLHQARERFQQIRAEIKKTQPPGSISVGFAPLQPEDTLEQLTERGDRALYAVKRTRSASPPTLR